MRTFTVILTLIFFALGMGAIYWLQHGLSQDFGIGFSVGLIVGIFTAALGSDRRRSGAER
jgi:hypothetical protein